MVNDTTAKDTTASPDAITIKKMLSDIAKGEHDAVIAFGIGSKENPDSLSFYTSEVDFNWVLLQIARGQFNLLLAQAQTKDGEEVKPNE